MLIINGTVVTPDSVLPDGAVSVEGRFIRSVGARAELAANETDTIVDAHGGYILPGFVDIHTHGALGIDVSEASLEDLHRPCRYLPSTGVTTFIPTTVTMPEEKVFRTLERFKTFLA